MYQRILIATDGTALSKKAVKAGIELAASLDAEVIALKVVPRYPTSYFEGAVVLAPAEMQRIEKQWTDEGQAIVDAVKAAGQKLQVKVDAITSKSDSTASSILATAKKRKCDLIIMASHGRKGIKRLLLGSETMDVLTHSTIPVLVLR